jgi:hypothetical protein
MGLPPPQAQGLFATDAHRLTPMKKEWKARCIHLGWNGYKGSQVRFREGPPICSGSTRRSALAFISVHR